MSKATRQIKAAKVQGVARVEHTETFDDHLLPDAVEIEKLHQMDPKILEWLKDRAEQEQKFRHNAYESRIALHDKHNKREHDTTRWGLLIYLILVLVCVTGAFILVREGKNLAGSLFGGTGVILALAIIITKKPVKPQEN